MEKYAILILPITLSIIILVAGSIAFYMPLRWEERQRERYPTYRGKESRAIRGALVQGTETIWKMSFGVRKYRPSAGISADQVFLLVRGSFLA